MCCSAAEQYLASEALVSIPRIGGKIHRGVVCYLLEWTGTWNPQPQCWGHFHKQITQRWPCLRVLFDLVPESHSSVVSGVSFRTMADVQNRANAWWTKNRRMRVCLSAKYFLKALERVPESSLKGSLVASDFNTEYDFGAVLKAGPPALSLFALLYNLDYAVNKAGLKSTSLHYTMSIFQFEVLKFLKHPHCTE